MIDQAVELGALAVARGGMYALVAAGFALVFGIGRVLNLFHGAFFLLGAYLVYFFLAWMGHNSGPEAVAAATLLAATVVSGAGLLEYLTLVRPQGGSPIRLMAVGLSANLVVEHLFRTGLGTTGVSVQPLIPGVVSVGTGRIPAQEFLVGGSALLLFGFGWVLLLRTRWGAALRAVAQNRRGALVVGIAPDRALLLAVAVAAFLAGLAGALTAPLRVVHPGLWSFALLKSFTVVIIGGIGSLRGTLLAAYGVGTIEVVTTYTLGEAQADFIVMALAACALLLRPRGIFDASSS
jgi:branched-chain amino acid transport system permease protein